MQPYFDDFKNLSMKTQISKMMGKDEKPLTASSTKNAGKLILKDSLHITYKFIQQTLSFGYWIGSNT